MNYHYFKTVVTNINKKTRTVLITKVGVGSGQIQGSLLEQINQWNRESMFVNNAGLIYQYCTINQLAYDIVSAKEKSHSKDRYYKSSHSQI